MALTDVKPAVQEAEQVLEPKVAADTKELIDHFLEGLRSLMDGTTVTITVSHKDKTA